MMKLMKSRKTLALLAVVGGGLAAFGRGESWVVKQQPAPPRATLTNEARYIEWKFREDVTDPATGRDAKALKARVVKLAKELEPKEAWCVVKARCYAALCDEMAIDVSPLDWFPAISIWNRYDRPLSPVVGSRNARIGAKYHAEANRMIEANNRTGVWMTWKDFDHSVPVWEELLATGFPGVRAEVAACDDGRDFYKALAITADATLRLVDRFAALGEKRLAEARTRGDRTGARRLESEVASLTRLRQGPPQTAYDVLNFIWIYFFCCEHLDVMQCRSLTIIDRTLWPYYRRDIAAGRTTEAEFREQFRHWLWQWGSVDNYWGQPITMGGTKKDGSTEYNPLSLVILDVMDECALATPKFHVKIAKNTPVPVLNRLLDMARRHRSLSFIGEEPVKKMLMSRGYTADEVQGFYTKGCYEVCVPNGANGTGTGYINLLKQVELTLAETRGAPAVAARYPTYAAFEAECIRRMTALCRDCMKCASSFEKHLDDVNPANVSTLGVRHAIRVGKDAFSTGSERGNGTDIQISALGTTVDALVAVEEIVYERKLMTLAELAALMAANWKGREDLQLRMRRSPRKWGNNDPRANAVAARIQDALSDTVNGKPNARGGVYGLCGHTARAFIYSGAATGATPDGRRAGEEFSKNLSPQPGADTEGVTALVQSMAALDSRKWPGDFPLDVMLHSSAVAGDRGLVMMRTMLSVYFENGGLMMQFIVTSPEELRDAQRHPERYENLQIRVCGWNVRWNDIPKKEQDAYILRIESIDGAAYASPACEAAAPRTVVGVVNWDCSLPSETYFGHYATASLSPAKYRRCTPYYADVKGPDSIDYHWRTVKEYEREMQYAIDAGIDYFAYCWYGETKDGKDFTPVAKGKAICCDRHVWELATARQLHAKSSLRDKLKLCAILVVLHPISDPEFETLARTMAEPWYQTACGRPLIYLFGGKGENVLPRLRAACRKVGAKDLYAVVLGCGKYAMTGDDGVQAISAYTDGGAAGNFGELVARNVKFNGNRAATGMPVIPNFTLGWDPSPRNDHNVPWCDYPTNVVYAPPATEAELLAGARRMAAWIKENRKSCPTGHILSFAWNEFEEGGWICPIWRANGQPDTTRLEAFRKAAEFWRRELDPR